jgi:hypothetical protein
MIYLKIGQPDEAIEEFDAAQGPTRELHATNLPRRRARMNYPNAFA